MIGQRIRAPEGECDCDRIGSPPCDYCCAMNLWAHEVLYGPEDDCDLREDDTDREEDEKQKCECRFCFCYNRTEFGICVDCSSGAHQG